MIFVIGFCQMSSSSSKVVRFQHHKAIYCIVTATSHLGLSSIRELDNGMGLHLVENKRRIYNFIRLSEEYVIPFLMAKNIPKLNYGSRHKLCSVYGLQEINLFLGY